MASERRKKDSASFAYGGLDRVMHEKARLSILTALLSRPQGVMFPELRDLCDLTDGNLARHVAVLADSGIVEVWKNHEGPRTKTRLQLSRDGRRQFLAYLKELERVIEDARADAAPATRRRGRDGEGWVPA
jgi:DNA-binding MarR family transcriptional regulator